MSTQEPLTWVCLACEQRLPVGQPHRPDQCIAELCCQSNADRAEIERLTSELEEMRETLHSQADAAQQRILTLEVDNLGLKRLLSPVEEG